MELTWYGRTCVRLRGKDAVVVNDPFQSVVGPTGRGITGDIVTFSHPDDRPLPRGKGKHSRDGRTLLPSSLDAAFVLDGPGEYEVKEVLVTGVRTYRDDARGTESGKQVSFVIEVDGVHTIHLGDIGHLLSEEKLGDIGSVDIACVPLGGSLSPTNAAALVAQLDPKIVVPMPICDDDADCAEALKRFFHEMGTEAITQPKLSVTASSVPISSSSPIARAALIVTALSASSGVRPNWRQATVIARGRLAVGEVPGLKSVPSATGTPRSMNVRAGAPWSFMRNQVVAGRTVATTGRPSPAAAAKASMPASEGVARWSAAAAPISAASSAPPDGASSSAWRRSPSP